MSVLGKRFGQVEFSWLHIVHVGVVLLLASALFSAWISFNLATTLPQVLRLLLGVGIFYGLIGWAHSYTRVRWVGFGLILCGLALALIAPFSVDWLAYKVPFLPPALYQQFELQFTDAIHPNVLAGYLLLLLPLPLAVLLFAWSDLKACGRILASGLVVVMSLVLVLTQSRGVWLAAALGLPVLLGLRWRRIGLALALLLLAGGGIGWAYPPFQEKLLNANSFDSLASRLEAWQRAGFILQDFPLGIGLGLYGEATDRMYPFFLSLPGEIPHAHNLWFQIGVDLGLPGLFAWCVIVVAILILSWRFFKAGRSSGNAWLTAWGAGLLCSQVVMLLHGMVDAVTWGMVRPAPLVWALWGMSAAGYRLTAPQAPAVRRSAWPGLFVLAWLVIFGSAWWQSAPMYQALQGIGSTQTPDACDTFSIEDFSGLTAERRAAFGGLLLSVGCTEAAAGILPAYAPEMPRAGLVAYHWGRVAWAQGDDLLAASWWQRVPQVNQLLLLLAQDALRQDSPTAMRWFDATLRTANTPSRLAVSLLAYKNAMLEAGKSAEFRARLAVLSDDLGAETAAGYRLEAERFMLSGDFTAASERFVQAIAAGMEEAETWYLLGAIYAKQQRLSEAEDAYRNALQAPSMIAWRRPWYLYQFAKLLAGQERFAEALAYQQEAARIAEDPAIWDFLSILYAQHGEPIQAGGACEKAHSFTQNGESLACQR